MERPAKRQRLFNPRERNYHEYYEAPDSEIEDEDEEVQVYNPDNELQEKRARLDYKLKSTFESLFEKYERDFDGIGDEIDLYTGEIVVNNGHLVEMKDEKDAGISSSEDSILGSETEEITNSSLEDDMEGEMEEDEQEEYFSEDEMVEDDMILRGFAQASQHFIQRRASPELESASDDFESVEPPRRVGVSRPSFGGNALPSQSKILAQFGPQLGPDILEYIKKQSALEDTSVEPAWRAPPLPSTEPRDRPKVKHVARLPDVERSPSPENALSIWATHSKQTNHKRPRYTEEENEFLLDFVAEARRRGLDLSSHLTWKQLEATHPQHGWNSWKTHYNNKFTFLTSRHVEESELSNSEASTGIPLPKPQKTKKEFYINKESPARFQTINAGVQRSTRVRKPAQRDPNIISWSDAVPILASKDPAQYALLVEDARRTNAGASFRFNHPTPASSNIPESHLSKTPKALNQYPDISRPWRRPANYHEHLDEGPEDELAFASLPKSPERVSCPHAACRNYASATYRVKRFDEEELSPLCLHLLRVHHTTPFPCGEEGCDRKGESGFFMQRDLVLHVREVHSNASALHRLRGRVDSALLDQGVEFRRPRSSMGAPRPSTPSALPKDSDFMSPPKGGSSSQQLPSPGHDKTMTPRSAFPMHGITRAGSSSLRVNHSSGKQREVNSNGLVDEDSYDSDIQILDSDPFLDRDTPTKCKKGFSCPLRGAFDCEKTFSTASSAEAHSGVHTNAKVKCSYPDCEKMISTAQPNTMKAHLKLHERDGLRAAPVHNTSASKLASTIPSTIPNSQTPSAEPTSSAPIPISNLRKGNVKKTEPPLRNIVDPSYEFSDEEEFVTRQVAKIAPDIIKEASIVPPQPTEVSVVPLSELPSKAPRKSRNSKAENASVPPAKVTAPASAAIPSKGSGSTKKPLAGRVTIQQVARPQLATPVVKPKARKSSGKSGFPPVAQSQLISPAVEPKAQKSSGTGGSVAEEDYDELSLGADDFTLIYSRPRVNPLPIPRLDVRVKREGNDVQESSELPVRKRRFSTYEGIDDIDELNADAPQSTTIMGLQSHIKKEQDDTQRRSRPILKPKTVRGKRTSGEAAGSGSLETPPKNKQKPAKVDTPLIDLVGHSSSSNAQIPGDGVGISIPSTSDLGSSPTARPARTRNQKSNPSGSPLLGLLTPAKLLSSRTIKQEGDGDVFKTPGGTFRRCGEDGLACGRPFCFKCGSAVVGS